LRKRDDFEVALLWMDVVCTSLVQTWNPVKFDLCCLTNQPTNGHRHNSFQFYAAFFVEGMFSLWVGFRSYDYASHYRSEASWQAVADLPLCQGRSRISEALCPEWIQTTKTLIPEPFWNALEDGKLRDERTWTAIRNFSVNCERRLSMEAKLRNEQSIPPGVPLVLPERVPTKAR
jgi:hypothetical protein